MAVCSIYAMRASQPHKQIQRSIITSCCEAMQCVSRIASPRSVGVVSSPLIPARSVALRRLRMKFQGETVELYNNGIFDFKQNKTIRKGDQLPVDSDVKLLVLNDSNEPTAVDIAEVVKGKKAVIFGLPGAYTSVCSSKHVPQYNERADELKAQGVDSVICLSVNDPWVMKEWAKNLNVDSSRVMMLADGEGLFHCKLGLLQHMPGLGVRAIRYSMLVDDGKVVVLNIEEPGGKSYVNSGPGHMLQDIANLGKQQA